MFGEVLEVINNILLQNRESKLEKLINAADDFGLNSRMGRIP